MSKTNFTLSLYGNPDDIAKLVKNLSKEQAFNKAPQAEFTYKDVRQAMYRYAMRISEKEDATSAELEAMTEAAKF